MRATGIVRRIDELGRVVIPKEIRRTLRIREGDPLEIYTDKDGEVILKKYSPIGEISNFAKDYTESLFRSLGHIACITDKDMIVSASGVSRKELWEKPISRDLEQAIQSRQVVTANRGNGTRLCHQRGGCAVLYRASHLSDYCGWRIHRRGGAALAGTGGADGRHGAEGC